MYNTRAFRYRSCTLLFSDAAVCSAFSPQLARVQDCTPRFALVLLKLRYEPRQRAPRCCRQFFSRLAQFFKDRILDHRKALSSRRDFHVINAAGRLWHGKSILEQSLHMNLDCFADAALRRFNRRSGCHAAGQIGNVGRVVRLCLLQNNRVTQLRRLRELQFYSIDGLGSSNSAFMSRAFSDFWVS